MTTTTAEAHVAQNTSSLGKRTRKTYVLNLVSSPELDHVTSESEIEPFGVASSSKTPQRPLLAKGTSLNHTGKRYQCNFEGCEKAYTKPTRLEEHKRSHTGHRPFVCETCKKSYLRETHLQAHTRSHQPEAARPLECPKADCGKRFWTSQHLRVHLDWHNGPKMFPCSHSGCDEAFHKHSQLRTHICTTHAAPGTKAYQCEHPGCTRSFSTRQHLKTHGKVHDDSRYTCSHPSCLSAKGSVSNAFPTWSALQQHYRTDHPPTCTHPGCNGKTFASHKGLRAHQKLHEEHHLETELNDAVAESDNDDEERPRKRRRGGEVGRDWKCEVDGCGKDFKSKRALTTHNNVKHLGRRDFVCHFETCKHAYGYKHLLQRHLAKAHTVTTDPSSSSGVPYSDDDDLPSVDSESEPGTSFIDTLTGTTYAQRANARLKDTKALRCPYPGIINLMCLASADPAGHTSYSEAPVKKGPDCDYVYSRAYDLRRHLKAAHGVDADKDGVDDWVIKERRRP